ncbi:MAG: phosphatidate cytidylyltransferase, partial [Armatimonadota bacterium]
RLVSESLMWPLGALTGASVVGLLAAPATYVPWIGTALWAAGIAGVVAWSRGRRGWLAVVGVSGWISACMGTVLWAQQTTRLTSEPYSFNLVCLMVPCLWAGDTLAYVVGKSIGKHKMAPSISPGKTWEGACGHLIGCALCAGAAGWLTHLPLGISISCGLLASVTGQVGDLLQSALKRSAMVKDSGIILPGHGGVLDRIDSMLLAVPPQVLFLWLVAQPMFHVKP